MTIMTKKRNAVLALNVAEAKRRLSELLGHVAFGGASVTIMRRGKVMAKLVPPDDVGYSPRLSDVKGWLDQDDLLFSELNQISKARRSHTSRALPLKRRASRRK